ncbi:HPP family protein [Roseiarcus fermentans]|nr:HPP family protein [Roseiarcus fermentans]
MKALKKPDRDHQYKMKGLEPQRPDVLGAWVTTALILGIASMLHLADRPFILFSLGGSCVILFGASDSPMAQPRSLIGGHFVGAATGLIFFHLLGDSIAVMSTAVATVLCLMIITKTVHSPAGATPLIAISTHASWSFMVDPVAIGVVTLLVGKISYQRLWLKQKYPDSWL